MSMPRRLLAAATGAASSKQGRRSRRRRRAGSPATHQSYGSPSAAASAERWPQDADDPARITEGTASAGPRLPLPRLREPPLRRRTPRPALGKGRRDEARQPAPALSPPPPARARGRLHGRDAPERPRPFQTPQRHRPPRRPPDRRPRAASACSNATTERALRSTRPPAGTVKAIAWTSRSQSTLCCRQRAWPDPSEQRPVSESSRARDWRLFAVERV
jgi:hypothetical protein